MKILKFETLIEDIENAIKKNSTASYLAALSGRMINDMLNSATTGNKMTNRTSALALIYDYDKANDYGKTIMNYSRLYLGGWTAIYWESDFKEKKIKINAAKELVRLCRLSENREESYKFIFWALMILATDKSDYEEHLSLICDFARMFKITDDEMDDIVQVIKFVFHETNDNSIMKTDSVKKVFEHVFNLFK